MVTHDSEASRIASVLVKSFSVLFNSLATLGRNWVNWVAWVEIWVALKRVNAFKLMY